LTTNIDNPPDAGYGSKRVVFYEQSSKEAESLLLVFWQEKLPFTLNGHECSLERQNGTRRQLTDIMNAYNCIISEIVEKSHDRCTDDRYSEKRLKWGG
jgi:hypothetical protein